MSCLIRTVWPSTGKALSPSHFASNANVAFAYLPVEILPYKTFGLPVIEAACVHYATLTDGLRKTAQTIPGVAPHFSTLHGWMGGLGERAMNKVHLKRDRATIAAYLPSMSLPLTFFTSG